MQSMDAQTLRRLAERAADPAHDPRHALLDLTVELLALEPEAATLPPAFAVELRAILAELRAVQPAFPSRRNTSPLFDRAGLGRPARQRAERLVRRLAALATAIGQTSASESHR